MKDLVLRGLSTYDRILTDESVSIDCLVAAIGRRGISMSSTPRPRCGRTIRPWYAKDRGPDRTKTDAANASRCSL
jgi:hypothetical protein